MINRYGIASLIGRMSYDYIGLAGMLRLHLKRCASLESCAEHDTLLRAAQALEDQHHAAPQERCHTSAPAQGQRLDQREAGLPAGAAPIIDRKLRFARKQLYQRTRKPR